MYSQIVIANGHGSRTGIRGGSLSFGHFSWFSNYQVEKINEIKNVSVVPDSLKVVDFEFSSPMSRSQHLPMCLSRLWLQYDRGFVNFHNIDITSTRYDSGSVPIECYVKHHVYMCIYV